MKDLLRITLHKMHFVPVNESRRDRGRGTNDGHVEALSPGLHTCSFSSPTAGRCIDHLAANSMCLACSLPAWDCMASSSEHQSGTKRLPKAYITSKSPHLTFTFNLPRLPISKRNFISVAAAVGRTRTIS